MSFVESVIGNYGKTNGKVVNLSQYDRIKSSAFPIAASEIINLGTYTAKECAKEAYVDLGIGPLFCVENVYDDNANSPVSASYYAWGETTVKANQTKESVCQNYSWYYSYGISQGSDKDGSLSKRSYQYGIGTGGGSNTVNRWEFPESSETTGNTGWMAGLDDTSGCLVKYNSLYDYSASIADWGGGVQDNKTELELVDDAAYQKSSQKILRIASSSDFQALLDNSSTNLNSDTLLYQGWQANTGYKVRKFLNKTTGRYLLLPMNGYRFKTASNDANELKKGVGSGSTASQFAELWYWTRDRKATANESYKAKALKITYGGEKSIEDMERAAGLMLRAVINR